MLDGEGATEETSRAEKVDANDGTIKFGLPWEDVTVPACAGTAGKPTTEAAKAEVLASFAGLERVWRKRPQLLQAS